MTRLRRLMLSLCRSLKLPACARLNRSRVLVEYENVAIDVIVDGCGEAIVLLPSSSRGSIDFDPVAEEWAAAGFRVLRPQPRGIDRSVGPMNGITLHDLARDISEVISKLGGARAVVVGHGYGNWVARMTAADYPSLVRGVALIAAAWPPIPSELSDAVMTASDPSRPPEDRIAALRIAFFAPGNDPSSWLDGWYPKVGESQSAAASATNQDDWWSGGRAPLLDLQAEQDPFRPAATRHLLKDQFDDRVSIGLISNASHALFPEQPKALAAALISWGKSLP